MSVPSKGGASIINFGRVVAKRIKRGLYAGRNIQFGNNVSEDGGNRTRRTWKPNAQRKRLYSEILDKMVQLNVSTHALRCVDKMGGLDNYILNTKPQKLMSDKAMELRQQLLEAKGAGQVGAFVAAGEGGGGGGGGGGA